MRSEFTRVGVRILGPTTKVLCVVLSEWKAKRRCLRHAERSFEVVELGRSKAVAPLSGCRGLNHNSAFPLRLKRRISVRTNFPPFTYRSLTHGFDLGVAGPRRMTACASWNKAPGRIAPK